MRIAHDQSGGRIALIIGNGVHRYNTVATGNDWNAMIHSLAVKHGLNGASAASTLALTELYDLIDLRLKSGLKPQALQEEFCEEMHDWKSAAHHHRIARWAMKNASPVLTTNFDHVLSDAIGAALQSTFKPRGALQRPTDYYPWEKYWGLGEIEGPCDGFGIWHINGLLHHIRSVRLGLTHYMGSVSRARPWFHGSKESRLFTAKNMPDWRGRDTWLHIIFNMPLLIIGLQLSAQEVFLRWLLIERARYFRQFPSRRKLAWYIYPASEASVDDQAKYFFLRAIGIQPIKVASYDSIYGESAWQ